MAENMEEKENQRESKFQGFLLVVAIPILFAIVVALVALSFLGINIFETAKDIGGRVPFLSEIVKEDKQPSVEEFQKNIVSLEAEIKDREAKVEQLQSKVDSKDTQLKRIELEKAQLQAQIEELTAIQEENKRAFREIVKTYETMSAKSAAPIISKMESDEAVKILTNIKPESLAAIMEKLPADVAARYTELLTNETESN
ncbi:MotE family protein [Bacillus sp. ISL-35]|uniref:MotE family protein n=1 Tax=Bacillus sp. ISL-35 TaxID=2819122 RepID=UPI001BEBDA29|nr:MotE family protein [Bacillus sp. ISL-35]MBT2681355.1 MotE family protein [Bacillus sp. ISL-35]MBT2701822.1 MotE family protein [Chryseobacterium sp. ISL-80]